MTVSDFPGNGVGSREKPNDGLYPRRRVAAATEQAKSDQSTCKRAGWFGHGGPVEVGATHGKIPLRAWCGNAGTSGNVQEVRDKEVRHGLAIEDIRPGMARVPECIGKGR